MIKKGDLLAKNAQMSKQILEMQEKLEQAQRERWDAYIPIANEVANKKLGAIFPNLLYNLRFEHVDAAGYWYSFELTNDNRRQTYCIRHNELFAV